MKNQTHNQSFGHKKKSGTVRWVILGLIVVALALTGLVAARITGAGSGGSSAATVPVRRGDLNVIVSEAGSIRARNSIRYTVQVERRGMGSDITILSVVPPGTYVTQEDVDNGLVLVELDSSSLEDALMQEEISLASDEENVTSAKEAYDIQVISNESDIASRQLRVRFALMDLQKYVGEVLAGEMVEGVDDAVDLTAHVAPFIDRIRNDPNLLDGSGAGQTLKRLNDDITLADGNLQTAKATLMGTQRLHDANYVSDLDLQRDTLTMRNRVFSLENAEVSLNLFLRFDFPKNCEQYLSDYIEAGRQLERTYAQARARLAQAQARLANATSRYNRQLERVEDTLRQIDNCTIRAIAPGLVIYGAGDSGDALRQMRGRGGTGSGIIAEGEPVFTGQVLISMPDTAAMVAEVGVHETEVDKVRPGQRARITMDAFPDRTLQGQVLEVAPLPDQNRNWLNPDLKVYQTLVLIEGNHDFLRTRMSCRVDILVRELRDVLMVPIQVVSNRGGAQVVYVKTGAGSQQREVTTGAFSNTFVQILDGLSEGEEVLLNPPLFADATVGGFEQTMDFGQVDPNAIPQPPQPRMMPGGNRRGSPPNDVSPAGNNSEDVIRRLGERMGANMTEEERRQAIEGLQQRLGGQRGAAGAGQRGAGRNVGGTTDPGPIEYGDFE